MTSTTTIVPPTPPKLSDLDKQQIQTRMKQLIDTYTNATVSISHRQHINAETIELWNERQRRLQTEFYSAMHYYEDLLYPTPHAAPPPPHITPYVPWTPPPKRGRGRPSTGGRKPRDRRVHKDDDSYSE